MIVTIEDAVFNSVFTACAPVKVVKGNPETTAVFPCVAFVEKLNTANESTIDSSGEFANDITYEINIFSNSETPIAECSTIRAKIDAVMSGTYGMRRTFSDTVPNYQDEHIYRYVLRYQCVVDKNNKIYRR